jgi:hypothetical protein
LARSERGEQKIPGTWGVAGAADGRMRARTDDLARRGD